MDPSPKPAHARYLANASQYTQSTGCEVSTAFGIGRGLNPRYSVAHDVHSRDMDNDRAEKLQLLDDASLALNSSHACGGQYGIKRGPNDDIKSRRNLRNGRDTDLA